MTQEPGDERHHITSRLRSLVVAVVASVALSGCVLMQPKGFSEGSAFYEQGDYRSAEKEFERLATENPENEDVHTALAESRLKTAESDFEKSNAYSEHDPRARIAGFQQVADQTERALTGLNKLLAVPYDGPGMADRAKKMVDEQFQTLRERQELTQKKTSRLNANANEALTTAKNLLEKVLADTARLLEGNRAAPSSTYDEFVALFPYAPHISEVQTAKEEIETTTIAHLEHTGLADIESGNYAAASAAFVRMSKIKGGENRADAGVHAIAAHQSIAAKKYDAAFESLLAIRAAYPESPFLAKHLGKTQELVVASHIKGIDKKIALGKPPGMIEAFDQVTYLFKVAENNAPLLTTLEVRRKSLRQKLAADYIRQAKALEKQGDSLYSSLILRNLRIANRLDPEQTAAHEPLASRAHAATDSKDELRIAVILDGDTGHRANLAQRLNSDLMGAMEKIGIKKLSLIDAASLNGSPKNLGLADLVVQGRIDTFDFSETGRESPRRKSSKYVSGTRQVKNPAYDKKKRAYEEAEREYRRLLSVQEAAKRKCREMSNAFARIACEAVIGMIASSERDSAYSEWQSTPETLPEDIISSYQYEEYTVRLNGQVRGRCALIDNLNRTETPCAAINEKIRLEGTIVKNAQDRDTEGIRNHETNVPDMVTEQEKVSAKISAALSEEQAKHVAAYYADRYCRLAESLEKKGSRLNAAEAYSLCARSSGAKSEERLALLKSKLSTHFGISESQLDAFSTTGAAQAAWPESGDSDPAMVRKAVMRLALQ